MKYQPIYLPATEIVREEPPIFNTSEEAWDWIAKNGLCKDCMKYRKPLSSQCAAEWDVDEIETSIIANKKEF